MAFVLMDVVSQTLVDNLAMDVAWQTLMDNLAADELAIVNQLQLTKNLLKSVTVRQPETFMPEVFPLVDKRNFELHPDWTFYFFKDTLEVKFNMPVINYDLFRKYYHVREIQTFYIWQMQDMLLNK